MVPVRLELKNFLSYGTEVPALDFEAFEVACLSGGNGVGKSALLDAMTWAIWGEARKSSGKRKPDDELIRIGTRHMEVTFAFDLEGTRYRVTRRFSRSKTGKTTSSELEFQVYAPDEQTYRPLTGSTQRETQARIDEAVGLDYDTFINSAFLLQGRSDEFTKKSPSQRKEILVRILNLNRYERLEGRARDRWRAAKERQRRAEADVERLQDALEDVPDWREEQEQLQTAIAEQKQHLAACRSTEKELAQARADLEARAREADTVQETIADLAQRIADREAEVEALDERIETADALIAQAEDIQSAYERHQALQEEREALEEKRERHRALEREIEQKKTTLRERVNELQRRRDRLAVERDNMIEKRRECEETLASRPDVVTNLRRALAARQRLPELAARKQRRDALRKAQEEAHRTVVARREQLQGELDRLQRQIEEEQRALEQKEEQEQKVERLRSKRERRQALEETLDTLEAKGTSVSEEIQELSGELEARIEERDRKQAVHRRFQRANGLTCPTCGTELTDTHRREVEETLQDTIQELEEAIRKRRAAIEDKKARRQKLRERYTALQSKYRALDGVSEALATARERVRALADTADALSSHTEQADAIRGRLETGAFADDARRRWQWCAQRRAALAFDPEAFSHLQDRAAHVHRYADRLEELDELDDRRRALLESIEEHEQEVQSLQEALEDGSAVADLRAEINERKEERKALDFDPERFRAVREALRDLNDAPQHRNDLRQARANREDWTRQRKQLRQKVESLKDEREEKKDHLNELQDALGERDELEKRFEAAVEAVDAAEAKLNELQQHLGMLNERLEQADRNETALAEARDERDEAKHERRLYKHLRTAFGKHGIPSLIIEETLPEIEERANRILGRLTDGRMHVRLETLKQKKSGGTKETLEIIIADEQGVPRPYETFSGGESFRVNFALRVALAQLLAERSGVRVRTLVVDEGFGTQDEEGIERLVDAIQSIRNDFAKVLVITHLERLKQAFPVRIEVEKDPAVGSTFELVGR